MTLSPQHFWQNSSLLIKALVFSVVLHGVLLTIRFVSPDSFEIKNIESPLEVVLVNAKSKKRPDKANVLAQNNLNGGGEGEQDKASTPLPAQTQEVDGDLLRQMQQRVERLEETQRRLLAQQKPQKFALPQVDLRADSKRSESATQGKDYQTTLQEIARMEAKIARDIEHESKRPKRAYLTATSAREAVYAQYYDKVRRKIEQRGTDNFPLQTNGQPLYGELVLVLTINRSGRLGYNKDGWTAEAIEVLRSSGNPLLDRQTMAIVRAAAPFGAFTPEMRSRYDLLEIISTFKFTREGLETKLESSREASR